MTRPLSPDEINDLIRPPTAWEWMHEYMHLLLHGDPEAPEPKGILNAFDDAPRSGWCRGEYHVFISDETRCMCGAESCRR